MIYLTMTLAVLAVELMHVNKKKYTSINLWLKSRWDNLAVSFVCGVALCIVFPELAGMENVKQFADLNSYPSIGGVIVGLSSTPIINQIKSQTLKRIKKGKGE